MMIHVPKNWKSDKVRRTYFAEQDLKLFLRNTLYKIENISTICQFSKKVKMIIKLIH